MNVPRIKDVNAQFIRRYQRNESVVSATDKQAGSTSMKTQEKVDSSNVEVLRVHDVRDKKVLEIKGQVERGVYNVSGEQIACKMMRESIIHLFGIDLRLKKRYVVHHFLYTNTADKSPMRDGLIPICFN